ncbi:MAG: hypothetical protein V4508_26145 [Pseudomonadota bacterium]
MWKRLIVLAWLAMLAPLLHAAGADDVVGMVLDVQGNGEMKVKGEASKLQLLSYLKPGTQIKLDAGARASVSHYGARLIYQLSGPTVAQVGADQIKVSSGTPAHTKSLAEKVVAAAINPAMGAAAFKMRGLSSEIALVAPSAKTALLTTRPSFKWEADEPASYQLVLTELPERVVARAKVDAAGWELPGNLALEFGKDYRWSVSYTSAADGRTRSAGADFSVATQAEAEALTALRPAPDAGVDEWVLYASILRDRRMLDDARQVWRGIATQRPDLAKAQSMAR